MSDAGNQHLYQSYIVLYHGIKWNKEKRAHTYWPFSRVMRMNGSWETSTSGRRGWKMEARRAPPRRELYVIAAGGWGTESSSTSCRQAYVKISLSFRFLFSFLKFDLLSCNYIPNPISRLQFFTHSCSMLQFVWKILAIMVCKRSSL